MRGDVFVYAAQAIPPIDIEIAGKGTYGHKLAIIKHKTSFIMKQIAFLTSILVGSLCFFSCISANSSEKEHTADIVGKITKITPAIDEAKRHGRLCTLEIAGVEPGGTEDRAIVTVTSKTHIFRQGKQSATLEDLKEGRQVEVKFTPPVLPTYPVMATAGEVLVLD